jgi:hypothetical protein
MQPQRGAALPGVIFDSDMGANIDAAIALAVLYGSASKVKLIGITTSNPGLEAAAFADVMARFYTTGGKLNTTPAHYHFPIGYAGDGKSGTGMLSKALALKAPDGSSVFGVNVTTLNDTAEVGITVRNALTSQKDGEAVLVVAGPATNLIRSMAMRGTMDLIAAKVGVLVLAAGDFSGTGTDPRIKSDIAGARKLFAEWPSPIVVVGREVGAAVPFPRASIASDYTWAPAHPVVEAYKAYKPLPYDANSQAIIAALYAADPKDDLFRLSEPGRIEVSDDGRTKFVPTAAGKSRYILPGSDPEWESRAVKAFTTLASAKPAAPMGRGPRPQQQAKPDPAKPDPAKP